MAENSENIEAKLCAYVEGDLDEAGRIEIERHLEAHPTHRRLLAELIATRDLLRYLPREQAPADLAETFNAQLERSELLDGPGVDALAPSMRINLLPRLLAVAAIVLLGAGLGVVVYFALPRGESGTQLAMPTSAPRRAEDSGEVFDGESAASAPGEHFSKFRGLTEAGGALGKNGTEHAPGQPAGEPVYMIVSAADPSATLREVTTNLLSNQISWEPAHEPLARPRLREDTPAVELPTDDVTKDSASAYAREQLTHARMKQQAVGRQRAFPEQPLARAESVNRAGEALDRRVAAAEPVEERVAGQSEASKAAVASAGQGQRSTTAPDIPLPAAVTGSELATAESDEQKKAVAGNREIISNVATPSPVADKLATPEPLKDLNAQSNEAQASTAPANDPNTGQAVVADVPVDAEVAGIVAYRMTRRQVMELGKALSRESQQVELVADDVELQAANAALQQPYFEQSEFFAPAPPDSTIAPAPDAAAETTDAVAPALPPATREKAEDNIAAAAGAAEPVEGASETASGSQSPVALKAAPPQARSAGDQPVTSVSSDLNRRSGNRARPGISVIRRGVKLNVTVDELAGPDTSKTTVAEVASDGTVSLPRLNAPLRIEGLTPSQAERVVAYAYQSAGVVDVPTVSIEPVNDVPSSARAPLLADSPTSQRAAPPATRRSDTTNAEAPGEINQQIEESAGPIGQAFPTTQGAAGADEPRVDVVILVQRSVDGVGAQSQPAPAEAVDSSTLPGNDAAPQPPAADIDTPVEVAPPANPAPQVNPPQQPRQPDPAK